VKDTFAKNITQINPNSYRIDEKNFGFFVRF